MSPDPRPMPYIKRAPRRRMEGAAINDISTYITTIYVYVGSRPSRIVCVLPARCLITTRDLTFLSSGSWFVYRCKCISIVIQRRITVPRCA